MRNKIIFLLHVIFYSPNIFCSDQSINFLHSPDSSGILPWIPSHVNSLTFSKKPKIQEPDIDEHFEEVQKSHLSSPRTNFAAKPPSSFSYLEWPKKLHRWIYPEIEREERLGIRQDGSSAYQKTLALYEKIATSSKTPAPLTPRSEEHCKQLVLDVMNQTQMLAKQWELFKQKGHMNISLEDLCIGAAHLLNYHKPVLSAPAIITLENLHTEAISEMTKRLEKCKSLTINTCS